MLTALTAKSSHTPVAVAQSLAAHPRLRTLDLTDKYLSDQAIAALAISQSLTDLRINVDRCARQGAQALAANRTLSALKLVPAVAYSPSGIDADSLAVLSTNTTLKQLEVWVSGRIGDLAKMASLESLKVGNVDDDVHHPISESDAQTFAQLPHLRRLYLKRATFESSAAASALCAETTAKSLTFVDVKLDTANVQSLLRNRHLSSLSITGHPPLAVNDIHALLAHPTLSDLSLTTGWPHSAEDRSTFAAGWAARGHPPDTLRFEGTWTIGGGTLRFET
jgi:hypothetical protein